MKTITQTFRYCFVILFSFIFSIVCFRRFWGEWSPLEKNIKATSEEIQQRAVIVLNETNEAISSTEDEKKVRILIVAFNRPEFLKFQIKSIKKCLLDNTYEILILNTGYNIGLKSNSTEMGDKITNFCVQHKINFANYTNERWYFHVNKLHYRAILFGVQTFFMNHSGISVLLDSDIFLVKPFSFKSYVNTHGNFQIGGHPRRHARYNETYMLPILLIFNNFSNLPDKHTINFKIWHGSDTGGGLIDYFKAHPTGNFHFFDKRKYDRHLTQKKLDDIKSSLDVRLYDFLSQKLKMENKTFLTSDFYFEGEGNSLFHFGSASNWMNEPDFEARISRFLKFAETFF